MGKKKREIIILKRCYDDAVDTSFGFFFSFDNKAKFSFLTLCMHDLILFIIT